MKNTIKSKWKILLCAMLFLAMSLTFSFGVVYAAADDEEVDATTLTVEAVGWGGSVDEAKASGLSNIADADAVGFQIWFSDPIDSGTPVNMLERSEGLSIEAAVSALQYIEINGKTLQTIFNEITAVTGNSVIEDGLLQLHVQGSSYCLQFSMSKNLTTVAEGKYASLGVDCYFNTETESPYKLTSNNVITVKAGFTAMGKTVANDVSYVFNPSGSANGIWIEDTAIELNVTSVSVTTDSSDEVAITVEFDNPINSTTVNHMARDSEDTVVAINGQEALDNIKANGLRDSVLNKLLVSGKTIKERIVLNQNTEGVSDYDGKLDVHVKAGNDGNKIEIHIKKGVGGSIAVEDGLTVTFLNGFRSDLGKFTEDVTYVYNPPVLDGQGGTWVKDTDTELAIKSVTSSVDESDTGNICIKIYFNNEVNKETVNFAARESEATVAAQNSQDPLDNIKANGLRYSLWNKIAINGYTINQLIQMNKAAPPENGDYDGQLDIHVKNDDADGNALFIYVNKASAAASVVSYEDGLTVSLLEGFRSDLAKVSESVTYEYTDGLWAQEGVTVVREELGIQSVTSSETDEEITITITFDQAINSETVDHMARDSEATVVAINGQEALDNIKANGLRDSVWNLITVGGKTIRELIDLNKEAGVGDWDGALDVHVKAGDDGNKMEIHIKKGFAGSVALEDGLTLEFLSGFKSDLVIVSTDLTYNLINGSWYKEGEEPPEQTEVGIVNVSHAVGDTDIEITVEFSGAINKEKALHMARESEATVAAVNGQSVLDNIKANGLRDSVRNLVMVNGKTISEIIAANQANAADGADWDGRLDVHIEEKDGVAKTMRIVLKKADGWVDFDSEDVTVTVMSGFHSDLAIVSEDITYTYNAANRVWLAPGEVVPDFEAVQLVSIDAPIMKDSAANFNVEFVLRFSEDIDNRQHTYISMDSGFVGSFVGSKDDYSESEIASFTKYGIFDSMANNVLLNGKSVQEMMSESGWTYAQWPNVAVVHSAQGGTGNNTLRLVIGGQYANGAEITHNPFQITDLNQNFVITIKAGLRTPLGQEVKEDISFIYDPVSMQWYEGDSVEDIPVNVTVTFMDGDTVLDTKTCLKGETITAGIQRKEGYTFGGWYTDKELTQEWDSSTAIEEDITVYAKFIQNENPAAEEPEESGEGSPVGWIVGGVVAGVVLIGGAIAVAVILKKRRSRK